MKARNLSGIYQHHQPLALCLMHSRCLTNNCQAVRVVDTCKSQNLGGWDARPCLRKQTKKNYWVSECFTHTPKLNILQVKHTLFFPTKPAFLPMTLNPEMNSYPSSSFTHCFQLIPKLCLFSLQNIQITLSFSASPATILILFFSDFWSNVFPPASLWS
jgi:hypothetical protein